MDKKEILGRVDHTLLAQTATWEEIKKLCDDAMVFGTASVCIPPAWVKDVKDYVGDRMKVCTVIGFPNGYHDSRVKVFETRCAIEDGADEIDMVIHIGMVKEGKYDAIENEIRAVKEACGDLVLKVIIETCFLTDDEKIRLCKVVGDAGADYIKTSTGFGGAGATPEDIALFKKYVKPELKIKAAGGISSFEDAQLMVELGADRLGTSRLVKLMQQEA